MPFCSDLLRCIISYLTPIESIVLISARKLWLSNAQSLLTTIGQRILDIKRLSLEELLDLCKELSKGLDAKAPRLLRFEFRRRGIAFIMIGVVSKERIWRRSELRAGMGKVYLLQELNPQTRYDLRLVIARTDEYVSLVQHLRTHTICIALLLGECRRRIRGIPCKVVQAREVEEGIESVLRVY